MGYFELILGALVVILISILWRALVSLTWRPHVITRMFREQGVHGPKYKFWSGNLVEIRRMDKAARELDMDIYSHDIAPRVLSNFDKWISQYGGTFLYWYGAKPKLCITEAEQIKQVLSNKSGFYVKMKPGPSIFAILGRGLALIEGSDWARHRRVVSPAFTMDKLKTMTKSMADCTLSTLNSWEQMVQTDGLQATIEVGKQFRELTADVISHSAFGTSYKEGKEVFLAQNELQNIALSVALNHDIPGYKYLPTSRNIKKWKLEKKMRNTLLSIIQSQLNSGQLRSHHLLGLLMECNQKQEGVGMNMDEIIDECKTFFFAGHETTSNLLTWTLFLLSTNQGWQERLREEVLHECGMKIPNADNLNKLKSVTMVLLETLRLYPPVALMFRKATKNIELGGLMIPKDTDLAIPIAIVHRKKELWGDDANEFNPLRFENGVTKAAKHPNALLAFGMGPRDCVGQNFAMLEAKMVLALILQRFSFSISPSYKHKPTIKLSLQPQLGLPIVLKALVV